MASPLLLSISPMKYFLHQLPTGEYEIRLDNETFDSRTGEVHEPLLITCTVHNPSGLHHLNNWIVWQNTLLENCAAAQANKTKRKLQTQQGATNVEGSRQG